MLPGVEQYSYGCYLKQEKIYSEVHVYNIDEGVRTAPG